MKPYMPPSAARSWRFKDFRNWEIPACSESGVGAGVLMGASSLGPVAPADAEAPTAVFGRWGPCVAGLDLGQCR